MDDLISRKAMREAMYHEAMEKDSDEQKWDGGCWIRYKMFERVIESLPSAQKTGKWLEAEQRDRTICSVCGYWQDLKAKFLFSFCPNCGSLMRGGYTNENISDS